MKKQRTPRTIGRTCPYSIFFLKRQPYRTVPAKSQNKVSLPVSAIGKPSAGRTSPYSIFFLKRQPYRTVPAKSQNKVSLPVSAIGKQKHLLLASHFRILPTTPIYRPQDPVAHRYTVSHFFV
jgi:hypothetical protein